MSVTGIAVNTPEHSVIRVDILRAAIELFCVRGCNRVELEDIAERAGVSVEEIRGLLGTKESLYAVAMHELGTP